jgi:hypothetical protein
MSEQPPSAWTESAFDNRCAYIITGNDQAVPKAAQLQMIERTGKEWIVREILGCSHMAPFLGLAHALIESVNEMMSMVPE